MISSKAIYTFLILFFSPIILCASPILEEEKIVSSKKRKINDSDKDTFYTFCPDISRHHIIPYCGEKVVQLNRFFFTLVTGFEPENMFLNGFEHSPTRNKIFLVTGKTLMFEKYNRIFKDEEIPSFILYSFIKTVTDMPIIHYCYLQKTNINKIGFYFTLNENIPTLIDHIKDISITSLIFKNLDFNSKDTEALIKLSNLTSLELSGEGAENNIDIKDVQNLFQLINLQSLKFEFSDVNYTAAQHLTKLTNLTYLDLAYSILENYQFLTPLSGLVHLNLYGIMIKESLPYLAQLTNLTYLDLGQDEQDEQDENDFLIPDDIRSFKKLTRLKTLDLSWQKIEEINMKDWLPLISLTELDIGFNKISSTNILGLAAFLTNLTELKVERNNITDEERSIVIHNLRKLNIKTDLK